jgi:hypothetical protein
MKQRRRIYYSAAQRSEIWDRWQAGEPIERRFLDGSACAVRCARLRAAWDDLRQPSAAKSIAMEDLTVIGLHGQIRPPGIVRGVPSFASWLSVRS